MAAATAGTFVLLSAALAGRAHAQSFTKISTGAPVTENGAWRSVNWVDYDRDGDLDLFVTRGLSGGQDNILFRNDGGASFDFTRMSGLVISQDHRSSDGSTWADYDNDGFPDAFVANWYGQNNLLYRNNRNGTFTRITAGPPVTDGGYSETATWGDYNNDGLVDLYVANSAGNRLNFLYRNAGAGQFVKVTAGRQSTDVGTSRGANWVDYDDDGDLDLFVANESNENDFLYRNMLVESGVDTFQRVSGEPLVSDGRAGWSASWADFDNDGDQDVFVANWGDQTSRLYRNDGGSFVPDSLAPIAVDAGYAASAGWGDMDNDGDLDLLVTHAYSGPPSVNYMYRNMLAETDTARMERVYPGQVTFDPGYMYGMAWGDYDDDGDLDIFVARTQSENQTNAFYRNDGTANHWLKVDLRGTASNAAGIGAKVRARATIGGTPVWQLRVMEGQSGYCNQTLQLHFGLGDDADVDSLIVEWPSGAVDVFAGVAADRRVVIVEQDTSPPVLVSPPEGFLNDAPAIRLAWNRPLLYPPFRLQVSTDGSFAGGILLDTLVRPDTSALIAVQSNFTTYHWRVGLADAVEGIRWSSSRSFDNAVEPPGEASPLSPAEGAQNVPVSSQLRWTQAPRTSTYRVRLSADSLFAAPVIDTTVTDTVLPTGILSNDTRYYWDVRGENLAGEGPVSGPRSYRTIIAQPSIPAPESPSDGDSNIAVPAGLSWRAADRAAVYRVQVSTDGLFGGLPVVDTTLADTMLVLGGLGSYATYFWRVRSTNAGGESGYSPARRFRTILAAPSPLEPAGGSGQFTTVAFRWSSSPPASSYHLQYGTDPGFVQSEYEDSTLADTTLSAALWLPETLYYWRVRALHPTGPSGWSAAVPFETRVDTMVYMPVPSWNLVSLPGKVRTVASAAVFPGAMTPFYSYETGTYAAAESLAYGRGYWAKFPSDPIPIERTDRHLDTIDVGAGWNLVGSLSVPIALTSVITIPPGLGSSPLYGYAGQTGGFLREDTIHPGRGYWIRMEQAGKLVFSADESPAAPAARSTEAPRGGLRVSGEAGSPPPPPPPGSRADAATVPTRHMLHQNYPNPFNPSTMVRFDLAAEGAVRVEVFNAIGAAVAMLAEGRRAAGEYTVEWTPSNLPGGVYYIRMTTTGYAAAVGVLYLK